MICCTEAQSATTREKSYPTNPNTTSMVDFD